MAGPREYVPPRTVVVPVGPILVGPLHDPIRMERYYTHLWGHTYQTVPGYVANTTTLVIEVGGNLTTWPDSYPVPAAAVANSPGLAVQKNTPVAGKDTVTLAIPLSVSGKFARIKVTP